MSMQPHDRRIAKAKIKTNRNPRPVDIRRLGALERKAIPVQYIGGDFLDFLEKKNA